MAQQTCRNCGAIPTFNLLADGRRYAGLCGKCVVFLLERDLAMVRRIVSPARPVDEVPVPAGGKRSKKKTALRV